MHAADRSALTLALIHFGNSLHNQHCGFDARDEAPIVVLDAVADVEWTDGKPVFYVATPPKGSIAVAGDIIEEVDGIAGSDLPAHDALRSNANSWFGIARAVALSLTRRTTRTAAEGSRASWTLRSRDGGPTKKLDLEWHIAAPSPDRGSDYAIDYARAQCSDLPAVDYGPYALASEGPNFCLYTSKDGRYRAYPVDRAIAALGKGNTPRSRSSP
jgi:hypothetical protein